MQRAAEALCHGAVTVVNAMATGRGAALGISLWTKARVTLTGQPGSYAARNLTYPNEDTSLMKATVRRVLQRYRADRRYGAVVETQSSIPVAAGLKSSSAASNAVALATLKALGEEAVGTEAVNFAVEASIEARVTLTGAYDDASACYMGGLIITDNVRNLILKRYALKNRMRVLIHVPAQKHYTKDVDRTKLRNIRPVVEAAHQQALRGNYWLSMTLNGLTYSKAFGYDTSPTNRALVAGAIAAGLSGKGPATAAIVPIAKVYNVLTAWAPIPGRIIKTSFNHHKARAWSLEY